MSYLGNTPTTQSFISGTDYFNGTGSQTAFTLSRTVASVNDVQVTVNNVVQQPNSGYTISGTTLTFDQAPSAGTNNVYVRYLSTTTQSITPSQNTVSYATWNSDLQSETWAFRNRIINGAMVIDQRNAGASVTIQSSATFGVDRWQSNEVTDGAMTVQQSLVAPTGFTYSQLFTTTTADSSLANDQFVITQQKIEGFNTSDLAWGTANAQTVTLSFWVRSSLTGTFGGSIQNSGQTRSYPYAYTISSANTWEYKTITIAGDTTGTWDTTNGTGMRVIFDLGSGPNLRGTANAWAASGVFGVTGAVSPISTNGATFYITGVQLEKGSTATNFDVRPYGTELALCQRYYWKNVSGSTYSAFGSGVITATTNAQIYTAYPVTMRALPTASQSTLSVNWGVNSGSVSAISSNFAGTGSSLLNFTVSGANTGSGAVVQSNNSTTGFLEFSAEL